MFAEIIRLCIAQPAFPATILVLLMGFGLAVVAFLEYPNPYQPRRRRRRSRRYRR
jgi:hypothetical protein